MKRRGGASRKGGGNDRVMVKLRSNYNNVHRILITFREVLQFKWDAYNVNVFEKLRGYKGNTTPPQERHNP